MAGNAQTLIHLEVIKKVFYTDEVETHALADIHLEIAKGEYVAIAGPSGCGKTTLLSILGLLDSPSEGSYLLDAHPVANLRAAERAGRAAGGGGGAGGGRRPGDPPARRADREPRLQERRVGDGAAARAAPRRLHDLHGDARRTLRAARRPGGAPVRRPRGRGAQRSAGDELDGFPAAGHPLRAPLVRAATRADADRCDVAGPPPQSGPP